MRLMLQQDTCVSCRFRKFYSCVRSYMQQSATRAHCEKHKYFQENCRAEETCAQCVLLHVLWSCRRDLYLKTNVFDMLLVGLKFFWLFVPAHRKKMWKKFRRAQQCASNVWYDAQKRFVAPRLFSIRDWIRVTSWREHTVFRFYFVHNCLLSGSHRLEVLQFQADQFNFALKIKSIISTCYIRSFSLAPEMSNTAKHDSAQWERRLAKIWARRNFVRNVCFFYSVLGGVF